jgi:O-antigen/teichoic acid export membrane protein
MSLWRAIVLAINLVGARFGGAAIALSSQILLARLLTQDQVGVVFMGMSAAAFMGLLVTGGYPQLAITCLPRYYSLGRTNLIYAFHAAFLHDSLRITLCTFAVAAVVYLYVPLDSGLKTALLFGCLSAPASAAIRINSSVANSLRRYALSYVPDFLYRPGLLLLFLLAAWGLGAKLTVNEALWAFVISNTIVAFVQALMIGSKGARSGLKWSGRHNLAPIMRSRAAALVIVGIVAASFSDIVTLISGFFLDAADVAVVGVAIRLAALAGFITQASQQFILPDLTDAMTHGTPKQVHALLMRINAISMAAILAGVAGAVVLGPYALQVFGAGYQVGHWPLVLFMVSQTFRSASGMNQYLLSLGGHQIKTAGSCIIAMVVLVASTALLTPNFGIMGLAGAVVVADVVWAILLSAQCQNLTGRRGDILGVLQDRKFHRA